MKKPVTVTITGAAGNIGYALAFRVAAGDMLGNDQPINLNLLEITPALGAVQGVVMELNDCAFLTLNKVTATDDARVAFKDCDVAMLVGARPRGPGMERKDLLLENAKIFSAQGKALDAVASRDVRVLVVGNPANTNALIAQRNAPSHPAGAIHGDDASRSQPRTRAGQREDGRRGGRHQESDHLGQSFGHAIPRSESRERGRQAGACRGGRELVQGDVHSDRAAARRRHHQGARNLLGGIGRVRGHRPYARLGARQPEGDWVSMAVPSDGSYGIAEGVIYSYPVTCRSGKYAIVEGLEIDEFSRDKMQLTHRELCEERDGVKDLI